MNSPDNTINLSEIFVTIQGEGRYLGLPSIFVRTSGCNLRCQWGETICDTPYTSWHSESRITEVDAVVDEILEFASKFERIKNIVLTGGEPLLQKNIDDVLSKLSKRNFFISLETNGTIYKSLPIQFVSISPKLGSSVPISSKYASSHDMIRYNKEALRSWISNYQYQLKFVINDDVNDEEEILRIISELEISEDDHIYLMPQGTTREQIHENSRKCIALSIKYGWRYTPRAHIEIYGNKRGT